MHLFSYLERIITFNAHIQLSSTTIPRLCLACCSGLRAKPLTLPNTSDRTLHRGNADLYMSSRGHRTLSSRTMTQKHRAAVGDHGAGAVSQTREAALARVGRAHQPHRLCTCRNLMCSQLYYCNRSDSASKVARTERLRKSSYAYSWQTTGQMVD
jgi:hypothetical protein